MKIVNDLVNPIDADELRDTMQSAVGFPHFCIDNFLKEDFANEIESAFPDFETAMKLGRSFNAHHEKGKVQVTNTADFPEPVKKLNEIFASEWFIALLETATGIKAIKYDDGLVGGGIHMTNGGGRLDVHVDFNYVQEKQWYRRLNLLLYFNKDWAEEYGGYLELWDSQVKNRIGYFAPKFNRLCGFVTSEISYHGVTPLKCPKGVIRKSFATYYYTEDKSPEISDDHHSTLFVPRPSEWKRQHLYKPVDNFKRTLEKQFARVRNKISKLGRKHSKST